jgi:hypothetical protein
LVMAACEVRAQSIMKVEGLLFTCWRIGVSPKRLHRNISTGYLSVKRCMYCFRMIEKRYLLHHTTFYSLCSGHSHQECHGSASVDLLVLDIKSIQIRLVATAQAFGHIMCSFHHHGAPVFPQNLSRYPIVHCSIMGLRIP